MKWYTFPVSPGILALIVCKNTRLDKDKNFTLNALSTVLTFSLQISRYCNTHSPQITMHKCIIKLNTMRVLSLVSNFLQLKIPLWPKKNNLVDSLCHEFLIRGVFIFVILYQSREKQYNFQLSGAAARETYQLENFFGTHTRQTIPIRLNQHHICIQYLILSLNLCCNETHCNILNIHC